MLKIERKWGTTFRVLTSPTVACSSVHPKQSHVFMPLRKAWKVGVQLTSGVGRSVPQGRGNSGEGSLPRPS